MAKRKGGHYCIGCGQYRANERFSGKGHRQHLCKDCKKNGRNGKHGIKEKGQRQWPFSQMKILHL
jgi:hypothetical protein